MTGEWPAAIKAGQDAHVEGRGPAEVVEAALDVAYPALRSSLLEELREELIAEVKRTQIQGDIPSMVLEAAFDSLASEGGER